MGAAGNEYFGYYLNGTGNQTIEYDVAANYTGSTRPGAISVGYSGGPDVSFTIQQEPCTFALSPANVAHGPAAASGSFSLIAPGGCSWSANSPGWIRLMGAAGNEYFGYYLNGTGNQTIEYGVAANYAGSVRTGGVSIGYYRGPDVSFTIQQEPCTLAVSPASVAHGSAASSGSFSLIAPEGCSWSASSPGWIRMVGATGNEYFGYYLNGRGNQTIEYAIGVNIAGAPRTGAVSLSMNGQPTQSVTIIQAGCCGARRPEGTLGDPGEDGAKGDQADDNSCGSPRWKVNVINMNLFITDTPMWYAPAIGPAVNASLSYNSQSTVTGNEPFGNKWQFNYGGTLLEDSAGSVVLVMPDGRRDTFSPDGTGGYRKPYGVHNSLTRLAQNHFEVRFPDDTVYVYTIPPGATSSVPVLTEIRDAYGLPLRLGHDDTGLLTSITDAQGLVFRLAYSPTGLCTNISDPFGRNASFEYDANRNLTKITDMGGYSSRFAYDAAHYPTSITDDRGTWGFRIEPSGATGNSDEYPPPGSADMRTNYRITVTNPLGQPQEFFYHGGCDQDGFSCTGYTWYVSPRDYVPWQSPQINNYRSRTPKTRYVTVEAGPAGQRELARIVYPQGGEVRHAYDAADNRTSVTDTHGHTWRYAFNNMGRVTSATDPKTNATTFAYADNGVDLLTVSDGLGPIRMAFSAQHDLVSLTDRLTNTTVFAYNTHGQIISQVDALGITNEYLYGPDLRLAELRRAGHTLERFTHDAVGRVRTRTDATGLTVTNDYNALNQVVRVTYPDGRFESYDYSTCCPRVLDSVKDRGGRTTVFIHDALKRLIQTVNPEGGITQFGYDANGNRTSLADPNGNVTTFAYDLDNRLIRKTYADGKGPSFGYNADGLLTTRTNARGIITAYTYDTNHNLLTTTYSDDTPGVTNTYDALNRLTLVIDGVGTNAYAYDANSRLASFDGPWGNDTITYAFDALGRRTNLLVQGSQPTGYDYDPLNRLTGVRVGAQTYAYTYAGASPLVQQLDRPNGSFTAYQYDALNRLTALSNRRSTGEVINEFLYAYNAQDLRASETVSNGLALTFTNQHVPYDYNRLNQLLTSAPPSQVFAYDDDGNMTRGFTPDGLPYAATYDAENRLKTITVTNSGAVSAKVQYLYSWNSFLAQEQREVPGQSTNQARHIRNRYFPVQERDAANTVARHYTWGLGKRGGIGGLLSLQQHGADYSYLYDGRWNVAGLLDSVSTAASSYAYDSFGVRNVVAGGLEQPFQFSTKPYNPLTGLSYFGFRFYGSEMGKWMSRDPLGERAGANLYAYVGNSPVNYIDPYGLECDDPNNPDPKNPDLNNPDPNRDPKPQIPEGLPDVVSEAAGGIFDAFGHGYLGDFLGWAGLGLGAWQTYHDVQQNIKDAFKRADDAWESRNRPDSPRRAPPCEPPECYNGI